MTNFIENLLQISITMAAVIGLLLLLVPVWQKRYSAKWRKLIWLIIAVRLLVPFSIELPTAPVQMNVDMHEAVETAVNIALREDIWTTLAEQSDIPEDFFDGILYIVWDEAHLPVLKAVGKLVDENLYDVRCVNHHTFLVAETLDRIIWFDGLGQIKLYSIAS